MIVALKKIRWLKAAWCGLALVCAGCAWPSSNHPSATGTRPPTVITGGVPVQPAPMIEADKVPAQDDIIEIHSFWLQDPWIKDPDGRPIGFRTRVYFVSGKTEKGEFVPGLIQIELYHVRKDPEGGPSQRRLAHRWELDEAQAMGFRIRKVSVMGYAYGFILKWPETLAPIIADSEIVFSYKRTDGRLVGAPPQRIADLGLGKLRRSTPAPAAPRRPALEARH